MDNFDQFEILGEIGQGGMGKVFLAKDKTNGKMIALKTVKGNVKHDDRVLQRFQKEAQAAVQLHHPNIVKTFGSGMANGTLYIGMEYIEGLTIADRLSKMGTFTPREALRITRQIAEALAYSHNLGIIHRDIKPQNLLLDKKGNVKILDFGIAKTMWDFEIMDVQEAKSPEDMLMTIGQRLGTPVYMPPEQMRNEPIDGRADIYALGATLYEMLTGKRPFIGGDVKEVMRQKEAAVHPGSDILKKAVPAVLATLVLQMLNKERSTRPRTASRLIQAIDETLIEMDALEKLRKRTEKFYDRLLDALINTFSNWLSLFLDIVTEPRFMAWSILLIVMLILFPLFAFFIRLLIGEVLNI